MAATTKPAKKTTTPKRDATLCHFGGGSYGSPATSKKCTSPLVAGKQLCADHETAWKVIAKKRAAAKKATAATKVE